MSTATTEPIIYRWRWWYKARCPQGNIFSFEGRINAKDHFEASDKVEKMMRRKYPSFKWMQGREIEGKGVTFGPTLQRLKRPVTKS